MALAGYRHYGPDTHLSPRPTGTAADCRPPWPGAGLGQGWEKWRVLTGLRPRGILLPLPAQLPPSKAASGSVSAPFRISVCLSPRPAPTLVLASEWVISPFRVQGDSGPAWLGLSCPGDRAGGLGDHGSLIPAARHSQGRGWGPASRRQAPSAKNTCSDGSPGSPPWVKGSGQNERSPGHSGACCMVELNPFAEREKESGPTHGRRDACPRSPQVPRPLDLQAHAVLSSRVDGGRMGVASRMLAPLWALALALAYAQHIGQAQGSSVEHSHKSPELHVPQELGEEDQSPRWAQGGSSVPGLSIQGSSWALGTDLAPGKSSGQSSGPERLQPLGTARREGGVTPRPVPTGHPLRGMSFLPPLRTAPVVRARNPAHNGRVCSTWGDFHYKTFDGDIFRFPGRCNYVLSAHCGAAYEDFNVQLRRGGESNATTVTAVTMKLDGTVIQLTKSAILVNGRPTQPPFSQSGVLIEVSNGYLKVDAKLGLVFTWSPDDSLLLELDPKFANQTCGLCGDFNGQPVFNEFLSHGVKLTALEYGNLQKMDGPTEQCQDPVPVPPSDCGRGTGPCEEILTGPLFSGCRALLDAGSYVQACRQDLCLCEHADRTRCLCPTLAEYARQCAHAGGLPPDWRSPHLCPQTCPPSMQHRECGSPCADTCSNPEHSQLCEDHCVDGCFCPEGTVLDDIGQTGCTPASQCPCVYNGATYAPGTSYATDCTNCTCSRGQWSCRELPCPGTCTVLGGAHISTFDERQYTVHGDCSYVLAKPCDSSVFTVLGELRRCGLTDTETCLRSLTLSLDGGHTVVTVKASGEVFVNQIYTQMPVSAANVTLFRPSTFFIVAQTKLGLQLGIQLVPLMQVFVRLGPELRGLTCGLCGNFNQNQADDFRTLSGVVEGTAAAFANTWKTQASCPNVKNSFEDPCSLSVENEKYAQRWCSRLTDPRGPFAQCHAAVSPGAFYSNCMFDTCNCENSEDCLCAALSSYVHACAAKGVLLRGWRDGVCTKPMATCPKSLTYQYSISTCQPTCRARSHEDVTCGISFVPVDGCTCPNGTFLDDAGKCVPATSCPCYHEGSVVPNGESLHERGVICTCTQGTLTCIGGQVPSPVCTPPMVFLDCRNATPGASGAGCQKSCFTLDMDCYSPQCEPGCVCPDGLVADGGGRCVAPTDCPCVHNEASYLPGQTIRVGCNTCTCENRKWQCTEEPCLATCAVYGDGHYVTFDGRRYSFSGDCGYTLLQDHCRGNDTTGTFRVVSENVPCGTTGVTCSKAIKLFLGSFELRLSEGRVEVLERGVGPEPPYSIRQMGIYLVVDTEAGLVLLWDRKTSIFLKLSPEFKGRVCGLCGNFDDKAVNDFTTRSQSVAGSALEFGNSWKFSPSCPDAPAPRDPCTANPYRKSWAQKQCSIINSATFAACHAHVEPTKYYEACVGDACACDSGGDCECFCTAVAAYAQACHDVGVCVSWRTPDICPLFCDYYNPEGQCEWHYQPCGAPCMRTCRNPGGRCLHDLPGLEGCYPKCPPAAPIFDEDRMQCVATCPTPPPPLPCRVRGKSYRPGTVVPSDQKCHSCICTENGVQCAYDAEACVCVYDGQHFRPGDVIYHTTDGTGGCLSARCSADGSIERGVSPCSTTSPAPASTFSFSTSAPVVSSTRPPPTCRDCGKSPAPTGTTPRTTVQPHQACGEECQWSPWLDISRPGRGIDSGDFDTLESLRAHGYQVCPAPKKVECQAEGAPGVPLPVLGQHVECSPTVGLTCYNHKQTSGLCHNYQIRILCCFPRTCSPSSSPAQTTPPAASGNTETGPTREVSGVSSVPTEHKISPATVAATGTSILSTTSETPAPGTPTPAPGTSTTPPGTPTPAPGTTTTPPGTPTPALEKTTLLTLTPMPISTTHEPCLKQLCTWTHWIDSSYPEPGINSGDFDTFPNLRAKGYKFCAKPNNVECRAEFFPNVPLEELGQNLICDKNVGLLCLNKNQLPPICYNYAIRIECCEQVDVCTSAPHAGSSEVTHPTPRDTETQTQLTRNTGIPSSPTQHGIASSAPVHPAASTTPNTYRVSSPVTVTCQPQCAWTKWFDVDFPSPGPHGGDVESFSNIMRRGEKICRRPEYISRLECRAESHPEVSIEKLGQVVQCDLSKGLVCRNRDQGGNVGMCLNYEVRVLCCEPPEHCTTHKTVTVPHTPSMSPTSPTETTIHLVTSHSTSVPTSSPTSVSATYQLNLCANNKSNISARDQIYLSANNQPNLGARDQLNLCANNKPNISARDQIYLSANNQPNLGARDQLNLCANNKPNISARDQIYLSANNQPNLGARDQLNPCANNQPNLGANNQLNLCANNQPNLGANNQLNHGVMDQHNLPTHSPHVTVTCQPQCAWTKWFDVDFPSPGPHGGDVESFSNIMRRGEKICRRPEYISRLECRAESHPEVSIEKLGQVVQCDLSKGLVCRNRDQGGNVGMCLNYEVRVLCCEPPEHCTTHKTVTVPHTPSMSPTSPTETTIHLVTSHSTSVPTSSPTSVPETRSTSVPTTSPRSVPPTSSTSVPTTSPTSVPETRSTSLPTTSPISVPETSSTSVPTTSPTSVPETRSTSLPTTSPISVPETSSTSVPTTSPTSVPETRSTSLPTTSPTSVPETSSTPVPTTSPTSVPTTSSTSVPTTSPTSVPTTSSTTVSWTSTTSVPPTGTTSAPATSTTPIHTPEATHSPHVTVTCQPQCAWTKWFDVDFPSPGPHGGDVESFSNIMRRGEKICRRPEYISRLECRAESHPEVSIEKLGQVVQCDLSKGLVCRNRDQGGNVGMCLNYEVRVLCCEPPEHCTTHKTVTVPHTPSMSPTSPTETTIHLVTSHSTSVPTTSPRSVPPTSSTSVPTTSPTSVPETRSTSLPTTSPISVPETSSTSVPTTSPTSVPETRSTSLPTTSPISVPETSSTSVPTTSPTSVPETRSTSLPTTSPTSVPTTRSTPVPTTSPTSVPTTSSTSVPTTSPTSVPTTSSTTVSWTSTTSVPPTGTTSAPATSTTPVHTPEATHSPHVTVTCQPQCAWTKWFDVDFPSPGPHGGDVESFSNIMRRGEKICRRPEYISRLECRAESHPEVSIEKLGQVVQCDLSKGLVCRNRDQGGNVGMCLNYEVRVLCCEPPEHCTTHKTVTVPHTPSMSPTSPTETTIHLVTTHSTSVPTTSPTSVPETRSTSVPTTSPRSVPPTSSTSVPTTSPTSVPETRSTSLPTTSPISVPETSSTPVPTTSPTSVPTTSSTSVPTTSPTSVPTTSSTTVSWTSTTSVPPTGTTSAPATSTTPVYTPEATHSPHVTVTCQPQCAWTKWFDVDFPSPGPHGGDVESFSNIMRRGEKICRRPEYISWLECRAESHPEVSIEKLGQVVQCDLSKGLVCRNRDQGGNVGMCLNYEVRVLCCEPPEHCTTHKTVTVPHTPSMSPTSPTETTIHLVTSHSTSVPTTSPTSVPETSSTPMPTTSPTSVPETRSTSLPTTSPISVPETSSTSVPTTSPTSVPETRSTSVPTTSPISVPEASSTSVPTTSPTSVPETRSTSLPTTSPISVPETSSTSVPTTSPTSVPETRSTSLPTTSPISVPETSSTSVPTTSPTSVPETRSTSLPTTSPISVPETSSTPVPTTSPTSVPTTSSTSVPTTSPTSVPTTSSTTVSWTSTTSVPPTGTTSAPATSTTPVYTPEATHSPHVTVTCQPQCAWTKWFDVDFPSPGPHGGDVESFSNIMRRGEKICRRPEYISRLECRAESHPEVSIEKLGQVVQCDLSKGLVCRNRDQGGNVGMCLNYEVRVLCCEPPEHCTTHKTVTVPHTPSMSPTSPTETTIHLVTSHSTSVPTTSPTSVPETSSTPMPTTSPTSVPETRSTSLPTTSPISLNHGANNQPKTCARNRLNLCANEQTNFGARDQLNLCANNQLNHGANNTRDQLNLCANNQPNLCATYQLNLGANNQPNISARDQLNLCANNKPNISARDQIYLSAINQPNLGARDQLNPCANNQPKTCVRNQLNLCANEQTNFGARDQLNLCANNQLNHGANKQPKICVRNQLNLGARDQLNPCANNQPKTCVRNQFNIYASNQPNLSATYQPNLSATYQLNLCANNQPNLGARDQLNPYANNQPNVSARDQINLCANNQPNLGARDQLNPCANNQLKNCVRNPLNLCANNQLNHGANNQPKTCARNQLNLCANNQPNLGANNQLNHCVTEQHNLRATYRHNPQCMWTKWFDVDFPSPGPHGGDVESFSNIMRRGEKICRRPEYISRLECRAESHPEVSIEKLGQVVQCDLSKGLVCRNRDQGGNVGMCLNYEVRVLCCEPPEQCGHPSVTPSAAPPEHTSSVPWPSSTAPASATCFCSVSGKLYPAGSIIYQQTDLDGHCYYATCSLDCHVVRQTDQSCPSSVAPPAPTTSQPGSSPSAPAPITTQGCPNAVPPRMKGETWPMPNCSQATCEGHGVITVHRRECPRAQPPTCANGFPPVQVADQDGCCPRYQCQCVCSGWGDPHYITFDGTYYTFLDSCTYVLVQQVVPVYGHFRVLIDNYLCGAESRVSCPQSIIIEYRGDRVVLTRKPVLGVMTNEIIFNDRVVRPGFQKDGVSVSQIGIKMYVTIPELGVQVMFSGLIFSVEVPFSKFANNTEGQCGTCTNDKKDECRLPGGAVAASCSEMSGHWKVTTPHQPPCLGPSPTPTAARPAPSPTPCSSSSICQLILSKVFEPCHAEIPPLTFYQGCVFDHCHVTVSDVVCSGLELYASLCASRGVCIDWRSHTNHTCLFACPADKVYQPCGPSKLSYCYGRDNASLMALEDAGPITEGCFCPEGLMPFSTSSEVCVPTDCHRCLGPHGEPVEPGHTVSMGCQRCTCENGTWTLSCQPQPCPLPPACPAPGLVPVPAAPQANQCCPQYNCACDTSYCPKPVACPEGSHPILTYEEGACCPHQNCSWNVCSVNGTLYQPGSVVSSSLCETCRCQAPGSPHSDTAVISCETQICNTRCPEGFEYREQSGQCCGGCVQQACVLNATDGSPLLFYPGQSWPDPRNPCVTHECEKHQDGLVVVTRKKACPPLSCPADQARLSEDGCCLSCPPPQPQNRSACALFHERHVLHHQGCTSPRPVRLAFCRGNCGDSVSVYSQEAHALRHSCECCQERRVSLRSVTLRCADGSHRAFSYPQVEECGCVRQHCGSHGAHGHGADSGPVQSDEEQSQELWLQGPEPWPRGPEAMMPCPPTLSLSGVQLALGCAVAPTSPQATLAVGPADRERAVDPRDALLGHSTFSGLWLWETLLHGPIGPTAVGGSHVSAADPPSGSGVGGNCPFLGAQGATGVRLEERPQGGSTSPRGDESLAGRLDPGCSLGPSGDIRRPMAPKLPRVRKRASRHFVETNKKLRPVESSPGRGGTPPSGSGPAPEPSWTLWTSSIVGGPCLVSEAD
ncbi:mucin-5AC [Neovison vison]|uniref:mucin-5AC n=1 Tax=Neovison vison TaxID=452646 RepID=UPI001CF06D2A|nr:mucin-5AC [Neogale vison]